MMPGTSVQGGFTYDNFGQADFPNGFNTNGPATLTNHVGATWTMPNGFNTSATFVNDGTATISNGFNQNGGVVQNGGTLTINGSTNLNGGVLNTGSLDFAGSVNVNSGALLGNACVMRIRNGLNNGSQVLNGGWIEFDPGTTWQNNGTFLQGVVGVTTGAQHDQQRLGHGLRRVLLHRHDDHRRTSSAGCPLRSRSSSTTPPPPGARSSTRRTASSRTSWPLP